MLHYNLCSALKLVPVWVTLIVLQGHRVLEVVFSWQCLFSELQTFSWFLSIIILYILWSWRWCFKANLVVVFFYITCTFKFYMTCVHVEYGSVSVRKAVSVGFGMYISLTQHQYGTREEKWWAVVWDHTRTDWPACIKQQCACTNV